MSQEGRDRAARALRQAMGGKSPQYVADLAGIADAATVRAFMDGDSWPWPKTRNKLERALGLADGYLEAVARGDQPLDDGDRGDPVVLAIERSELIDWRASEVRSFYQKHLYDQRREASA